MKAIAVIPARGGSRRVPGKNWKMFHGKPIIAYSIETALLSGLFEEVYVSTDSAKIAAIAIACGAKVIDRPCVLAQDEVGTQQVIADAIEAVNGQNLNLVCGIYPTAPMLTIHDLVRGRMALNWHPTLFSFSVGTKPLHDAGQFYWGRPWAFTSDAKLFDQHTAMIPIEDHRVCDINTIEDWHRAEKLYADWKGLK